MSASGLVTMVSLNEPFKSGWVLFFHTVHNFKNNWARKRNIFFFAGVCCSLLRPASQDGHTSFTTTWIGTILLPLGSISNQTHASSTRSSQVVSNPRTVLAQCCLTAVSSVLWLIAKQLPACQQTLDASMNLFRLTNGVEQVVFKFRLKQCLENVF